MRKKKLFILCLSILLITNSCFIWMHYSESLSEKDKKQEISNNLVTYLMSIEQFKYEIPEEIEVKYDKDIKMYIAFVKFENNPKKATVFISTDNEIENIIQ